MTDLKKTIEVTKRVWFDSENSPEYESDGFGDQEIRILLDAAEKFQIYEKFIEEERNAIFYAMTSRGTYDIGLAKERMTKILQENE